jgi:hypothetical protein
MMMRNWLCRMPEEKMKTVAGAFLTAILGGISAAYAETVHQDQPTVDTWAFKLTPSYYVTTNVKDASDINLRVNHGGHAVWIGYYNREAEFQQTRTGYENTVQFSIVQLVSSLQLASQGFVGGSVNAQIGDAVYALLGLGRTNARDYYNLNFDPNDSLTYGVGTTLLPQSTLSLFTVMDNRLDTGQVITHAVWKLSADGNQKLTVDLSSKYGRASVNDEPVFGGGLAVTYEYKDVFFRIADDRKVNFSAEDQMRFAIGMRF